MRPFPFARHAERYVSRQSCSGEIDAITAHGYTFLTKSRELSSPLSDGAVGSHHAMPRNLAFGSRQDMPDQARRVRIDIAVRLNEALGYCAHEIEDARNPRAVHVAYSNTTETSC